MGQVNQFIATAFLHLKAPQFDPVRGHLASVYQEALEAMAEIKDEDQWRKLQGRAQLAKELLDLVESSDELVAKFSRLPQKR